MFSSAANLTLNAKRQPTRYCVDFVGHRGSRLAYEASRELLDRGSKESREEGISQETRKREKALELRSDICNPHNGTS